MEERKKRKSSLKIISEKQKKSKLPWVLMFAFLPGKLLLNKWKLLNEMFVLFLFFLYKIDRMNWMEYFQVK